MEGVGGVMRLPQNRLAHRQPSVKRGNRIVRFSLLSRHDVIELFQSLHQKRCETGVFQG